MKKQNLIALGLITVLIMGIVLMSGCVEEEPTKKVTTTVKESTPKQTKETTTTMESGLNLKVGETATTSKAEVTVLSVEVDEYYLYWSSILNDYQPQLAEPGNLFVLAEVEIKNLGDNSQYVTSTNFKCVDSEGYSYDSGMYLGSDNLMLKEIAANQKIKGKVVFEVPETAKGLKIQYDFGNLFTGTKLASWEIE